MYQITGTIDEDLEETIQKAACEAVEATRWVVKELDEARFMETSRRVPGCVQIQKDRLLKGEEPPVYSRGTARRASSQPPPRVRRDAPAVNITEREMEERTSSRWTTLSGLWAEII